LNNIKKKVEHLQEEVNNTTKKLNINKRSQNNNKRTIEQHNYQNQATKKEEVKQQQKN
jgi:hypothetical protein